MFMIIIYLLDSFKSLFFRGEAVDAFYMELVFFFIFFFYHKVPKIKKSSLFYIFSL